MSPPQPTPNPLAGRVFEQEAQAILDAAARTKSEKKRRACANQIETLCAIANFSEVTLELRKELHRGKMVEHGRREPEVELVLEAAENMADLFPDSHLQKTMSVRFFQLLSDVASTLLASTREFHPVIFRSMLNDGWRTLGRAEEVAWSIGFAHETGIRGGTENGTPEARELRAILLEDTHAGTVEQLAERFDMSPRNVSFIKAALRRRQTK